MIVLQFLAQIDVAIKNIIHEAFALLLYYFLSLPISLILSPSKQICFK